MGGLAILLACALAGTLVIETGVANAASRGFFIYNDSKHALRLESASHLTKNFCDAEICRRDHPGFNHFEGRPDHGAVLGPHAVPHDWELKYFFNFFGLCKYAAAMTYKIEGTDATFDVAIETCAYSNNSFCRVTPEHHGYCTAAPLAGGRRITYHGP